MLWYRVRDIPVINSWPYRALSEGRAIRPQAVRALRQTIRIGRLITSARIVPRGAIALQGIIEAETVVALLYLHPVFHRHR